MLPPVFISVCMWPLPGALPSTTSPWSPPALGPVSCDLVVCSQPCLSPAQLLWSGSDGAPSPKPERLRRGPHSQGRAAGRVRPGILTAASSGINPASLRGTNTGVWVGVSGSEASEALSRDPETLVGYSMVGCQRAMMANRLSFFFNFKGGCSLWGLGPVAASLLQAWLPLPQEGWWAPRGSHPCAVPLAAGPSIALDTACSSSLLALHCAAQAIRSGECPAAIVGGINILLKPNTSVQFMKLGMLSPEGTCKSFDEEGESAGGGGQATSIPPPGTGAGATACHP